MDKNTTRTLTPEAEQLAAHFFNKWSADFAWTLAVLLNTCDDSTDADLRAALKTAATRFAACVPAEVEVALNAATEPAAAVPQAEQPEAR